MRGFYCLCMSIHFSYTAVKKISSWYFIFTIRKNVFSVFQPHFWKKFVRSISATPLKQKFVFNVSYTLQEKSTASIAAILLEKTFVPGISASQRGKNLFSVFQHKCLIMLSNCDQQEKKGVIDCIYVSHVFMFSNYGNIRGVILI